MGRDVHRVRDEVLVLSDPGLIENSTSGGVHFPLTDTHKDIHLRKAE